ncbi:unnamed protein product [Cercopithifilaria johnstoni]|uniref:Uncharacterized protein n=1 Tax=Cercopithifilaria johnstoni TaxID=2874296 RepID=A0A8J2LVI8_9BILA|nr:unnamed protein product [Cercopithifilaria johnstoni]
MELYEGESHYRKKMQDTSKIPIVKFTKARGQSKSSLLLSPQSDYTDNEDSGLFVTSFYDSVYANESDQVKKIYNRGQTCEQPRTHQFLWALPRDTSDCDSDSAASCSSKSKTAKISKKKLRAALSSVHQPELLNAETNDRNSTSSSDSSFRAEYMTRISAIFDKAKNRERQLVHSHKNKKVAKNADSLGQVYQTITAQDARCVEDEIGMQNSDYAPAEALPSNKDLLTQSSSFFDWFHVFKASSGESSKAMKFEQPWMFQVLIKR